MVYQIDFKEDCSTIKEYADPLLVKLNEIATLRKAKFRAGFNIYNLICLSSSSGSPNLGKWHFELDQSLPENGFVEV